MAADAPKVSGGLFRTDGGVKASSGLDVSDAAIAEAWQKVRDDSAPEKWMLLSYDGKSKLKLHGTGTGGADELLDKMTDDEVYFGGLRTSGAKFLCLQCVGEGVGAMAKGRAAAHKNAAFNSLEGTVEEVCGTGKEEFAEKLKKLDF
mmetsp:Transcript_41312/g.95130  ORF Transcript_41312/g.95130 Transcript_41312/m.95130 type:complete len:147 (-) Transcript_41312:101-541(-)